MPRLQNVLWEICIKGTRRGITGNQRRSTGEYTYTYTYTYTHSHTRTLLCVHAYNIFNFSHFYQMKTVAKAAAKGADQSRSHRDTYGARKTARRQMARPQWHPCGSPAPHFHPTDTRPPSPIHTYLSQSTHSSYPSWRAPDSSTSICIRIRGRFELKHFL